MVNFWHTLPKPFSVLAPMDDVTDNVFRKVIQETARPDVFFTEFTNTDGIVSAGSIIVKRKLKYESDQRPIVAQIWGSNPESFYKAAKVIRDLGFDGIDINMGCPVADVIKKCAGAGLIGKYELAKSIINAVQKGAGSLPVSVKTRLGIDVNVISEWAEFLLKQNLAALSLHLRTAKEMSKTPAHWEELGNIVKMKQKIAPHTLLIGNGDVKSYKEILEKSKQFNIDGVMVGRGVFDDPWIFDKNTSNIPHKELEYVALLLKHLDYFEKENPDSLTQKKRFPSLKKFFKMYIKGFSGANFLRQKLMETKSPMEVRQILASNSI